MPYKPKFKIDIILSAGFVQLCAGAVLIAINISKLP
jgi:hypothetical protein